MNPSHDKMARLSIACGLITLFFSYGAVLGVDGLEREASRISNGSEPSGGMETWQLQELWRRGGEDDGLFFGLPVRALNDAEGNIYLLDRQLSHIFVLSPEGELLRTLSRKGEGPGEMNSPADLLLMPDGTLGIVHSFPAKIVRIDRAGIPAENFIVGGDDRASGHFTFLSGGKCRAGRLVLNVMHVENPQVGQKRLRSLALYAEDGRELTRYLTRERSIDFSNLKIVEKEEGFIQGARWAIGPQGRIYAAPDWDRYEIEVYSPDGRLEKIIERNYKRLPRSAEQLEKAKERLAAASRDMPIDYEPADCERAISGLRVTDDGWLWVQSGRSDHQQPPGVMRTYDVFDPKGSFCKQVAIACEGDAERDAIFFIGRNRIILVTEFTGVMDAMIGNHAADQEDGTEDGPARPLEVICYASAPIK